MKSNRVRSSLAGRSDAALGAGLAILSSFLYASYAVWTKLIGNFFGAFTQATLRHVFTSLLLIGVAVRFKQLGRIYWRRDKRWFALSFVSSAIIPASLYYSVLHAGVSVSVALGYIGIVIGMFFFGWLLAHEPYTKDKWLSTALGVVGLCLVFSPSVGHVGWWALGAAFVYGLGIGLNVVASKKMPYNTAQTAVIAWTLGTFANLPFIFLFQESMPASGWHIEWLYLGCFAVISVLASLAMIRAVKLVEAGVVGVLGLLEVIFGILLGVILFDERPGLVAYIGMAIIVAAAAVPYLKDYNAKHGTLEDSV